jgi:hypothetical protein
MSKKKKDGCNVCGFCCGRSPNLTECYYAEAQRANDARRELREAADYAILILHASSRMPGSASERAAIRLQRALQAMR